MRTLSKPKQDGIHTVRSVIQQQHNTDGQERSLPLADEVGNGRFKEFNGLFGEKLLQAEQDFFRLQRGVRDDAQKQNHRRKEGHEQAKLMAAARVETEPLTKPRKKNRPTS